MSRRQLTAEDSRRGGKVGGRVVSRDRAHMARIGLLAAMAKKAKREAAERARQGSGGG